MHDTTQPRARWRAARLIALIAFSLATLALPLTAVAPAQASTHGAGEYDDGHWHGNYVEDGAYVYCLDYHLDWDGGLAPTWVGSVSSYGTLAPAQLAAIGAVVAAIGQTSDPAEARAIADAIWFVTDGIVPWGPTAPRAQQVIDWMAAWVAAPDTGTVSMSITASAPGARDGVLRIDGMTHGSSVTGTIELSDAVFVDGGADRLVGTFSVGETFPIVGRPSAALPYRMGATLTGTSTLSAFAGAAPVYSYGPTHQNMVGPAPVVVIPMSGVTHALETLDPVVLSTRTEASVPMGAGIRDTATIDDFGAGLDLGGWSVGFELYEFGSAADGSAVPDCRRETLVFTSATIPVAGAGDYVSDAHLSARPGTYGWVATLYDAAQVPQLVGVCGEPAETVRVEALLAVTGDASAAVGLTLAGGLALGGAGFAAAAAHERRRGRGPRS